MTYCHVTIIIYYLYLINMLLIKIQLCYKKYNSYKKLNKLIII